MVLGRPTRPRTSTQKRCPFHHRGVEFKSRKSRDTWSNRQVWPGSTKWSRAKANSFAKRTNILFQQHKRRFYTWTSPDGQNWNHFSSFSPLCPTLCNPMDCSLPDSSIDGILQARVLEWGAIAVTRPSPYLAAKNIINLILVLTIWRCPCVESSLVLFEEGVCYDQCIFLAKLY